MTAALREHVLWVTALGGAVDHAVTQVELAAGSRAAVGGYRSVCGDQFLVAPMAAEPGAPCAQCTCYLHARATLRSFEDRAGAPRHRRESVIRSFLASVALRKPPVDSSRLPRGASLGESNGHARRDVEGSAYPPTFRRASTYSGWAS